METLRNPTTGAPMMLGFTMGIIHDNKDPAKRGRVRLIIPAIIVDEVHPSWALPAGVNHGADRGSLIVPPKGTPVFVTFLDGNPDVPVWIPGPFGEKGIPKPVTDQPNHIYPNERVLYASDTDTSVVETPQGDVWIKLAKRRELKIDGNDTFMFLDVGHKGKIEINRPLPEQKAARKGDKVDAGTLTFAFSPGPGAPTLAITYTPPEGSGPPTVLASGSGEIPLQGIITTGSDILKIADK